MTEDQMMAKFREQFDANADKILTVSRSSRHEESTGLFFRISINEAELANVVEPVAEYYTVYQMESAPDGSQGG